MNMNNFGIVEGRMAKDPTIFTNKDGSRKVKVTVAARRDYKSADGTRKVDYIDLECYIPSDKTGNGAFDYLHKGDRVGFQYTVRQNVYEKDGKTQYEQVHVIEKTDLKETKRDNAQKAAATAAEGTAVTPDSAPVTADDDAPFGE